MELRAMLNLGQHLRLPTTTLGCADADSAEDSHCYADQFLRLHL